MPRVLHVTEVPDLGIRNVLKEMTREQSARGYEVHVLASRSMLPLPGVRHHDWSISRRRPTSYPRSVRELNRTIRDVAPDVIHLHSFFAGLLGRLPALAGHDIPIVYQPHAWSFDVFGNPGFAAAMRAWERIGNRRTTVLVTNCFDEIDEGRRVGIHTRSVALGVAIDTDRFAPVDEVTRQRYRVELGIDRPAMLLCLGRLARQKGQDQLAAAWERDPIPGTVLAFVGVKDEAGLRRLAPTQWGITITSVGPQSDVRPWLWACSALVLPSRYDTVSLAVPEAMACARPAVATGVNGVEEILTGGSRPPAGSVVPLGDMTSLLVECRKLLADPGLRSAREQAARARALDLFAPGAVVDRLEDAYDQAMRATVARA